MANKVTIDGLPDAVTVSDSDLLIVQSASDGVTRQITKLELFSELQEDVGDILTNGVRSVVPELDDTYDLGSSVNKWRDLYLSGQTIYLGDKIVKEEGAELVVQNASAVRATAFIGDGSQLTGITGGGGDFTIPLGDSESFFPRAVQLQPITGQVIRYDSTGLVENDTLQFKAVAQNFFGFTSYQFFVDGTLKQTINNNLDSAVFTLADEDEPLYDSSSVIKVTALEDGVGKANDFVTIFGIKNGVDGIDAITAFLTNEVHAEPATVDGALTTPLSDAGGTFKVFIGAEDFTGHPDLTYSVASLSPVSGAFNVTINDSGVYNVINFDSTGIADIDKGVANLRVVVPPSLIPNYSASATIDKTYSIVKIGGGAGTPGASAKGLKLLPINGQVIRYDSDGVTETDTLQFKAVTENFDGVKSYQFYVDEVLKSTINNDLDSAVFTLSDGDEPAYDQSIIVKVSALSDGVVQANDYVSVYGVKDGAKGADAVTVFLTNEVHVEPADSAGVLSGDLTDAGGTFKVFVGSTDVTGDLSLTYSVVNKSPVDPNFDVTIGADGVYTVDAFDANGFSDINKAIADLQVVVPASLIPEFSSDLTLQKRYSISKALGGPAGVNGQPGAQGEQGRALKLLPLNGQVIRYDSVGNENDSLTFRASVENFNVTPTFQFYVKNASDPDNQYVLKQSGADSDFTLLDEDEPSVNAVKVVKCVALEGVDSVASDIVSVYGLVNGYSVTGFLTNEAHVEPADSDGVPTTSLDDGGGIFKVFLGTTEIRTDAGVTYSTVSNTGINVSIDNNGVYSLTSFASDNTLKGSALFRATVAQSLIPGASADYIIEKSYSVAKSKQGVSSGVAASGLNARTVKLIADNGQVIRYDSSGTIETDTLTFSTEIEGFSGSVTYDFSVKNPPNAYVVKQAEGASSTFTLADGDEPLVDSSAIIRVQAYEDGIIKASDYVTVYGISNGSSGTDGTDGTDGVNGASITAFLTNETHVEPYDSAGIHIGGWEDAGGTFKVYAGTTDITTNCTFTIDSVSTGLNGNVSIGANTGIYSVSNLTTPKANVRFQAEIPSSYIPLSESNLLIDKVYSIAKSQDGASGTDGQDGVGSTGPRTVTGYIYYTVAQEAKPTTPSSSGVTYNFSTARLGNLPTNWVQDPPAVSANEQYWYAYFSIVEDTFGGTYTVTFTEAYEWTNFFGLVTFNALDSALGTAGTTEIDGGRITTGYIDAQRINAGTITAEKLTLGADLSVLNENPSFEAGTVGWQTVGTLTWEASTLSPYSGTQSARITATANNDFLESKTRIPASPGESFYADAYVRSTVAGAQIQVFIVYYDATGVANGSFTSTSTFTTTTSYQKISASMDSAPANTAFVSVRIRFGDNTSDKVIYVDEVRLLRKINNALIVDGGISAEKLTINQGNNLLTDISSFEQYAQRGTVPGYAFNSIHTVTDSVPPVHGNYTLKLTSTAPNGYKFLNPYSESTALPWVRIDSDQDYILSAYVRIDSVADSVAGTDVQLTAAVKEWGTNTLFGNYTITKNFKYVSEGWVRISRTITGLPPKSNSSTGSYGFALYARNVDSGVTSYWDGIQLERRYNNSTVPSAFSVAGTTVIDGRSITTGTINAGRIDVDGVISAGSLIVQGAPLSSLDNDVNFQTSGDVTTTIQSYNYTTFDSSNVQAVLDDNQTVIDGARITTGVINAARIGLNLGSNLITDVASLEQYGIIGVVPGSSGSSTNTVTNEIAAVHGSYVLKHVSTGSNSYKYLHPTSNTSVGWIRVEEGEQYILSGYVRTTSVTDTTVRLIGTVKSFGGATTIRTDTVSANINFSDGWVRISALLPAIPTGSSNSYAIYVRNVSSGVTTYWDGFQLEKYNGITEVPSPFFLSGSTTIDGGTITTGQISADRIDTSNLVVADDIADFVTGAEVDDNVVNPANFNLNKTSTGVGRTTISGDGVKIESWNGSAFVTRVKLGNLSAL